MAYDQGQVDQIFNQYLGRSGTSAEHDFLKSYVDQGFLSPYQIGQYLQGTPEALQARQGQQLGQYQNLLTQNNGQVLKQAADAANASFAQNGRQFSSGQGNAVIQAGQQLAAQQSPMIAAFYGNNAVGLNNQYAQNGSDALSRAYGLQDSSTQFDRSKQLYGMEMNDYNNYLNAANARQRQQGFGSLIGAGLGAAVGGSFGGLPGAKLGAGLGSMGGGLF